MIINFAGQDQGLVQNWLVGGRGGCRPVHPQPTPALPHRSSHARTAPSALRCCWTKGGCSWAGGMNPGITPAPQCSPSWPAPAQLTWKSVIQTVPLESPPGTSLFLFLKILESPLFPGLQCHWALGTLHPPAWYLLCLNTYKDTN